MRIATTARTTVHHERLIGHLVEGDDHDLGRQDEVGSDRTADHGLLLIRLGLIGGRLGFAVTGDELPDLLGRPRNSIFRRASGSE
jgi:hypothetical protein